MWLRLIKALVLTFAFIFSFFSLLCAFCAAALPIGAHEPAWFMKDQHCSPDEAVKIHQDLGAKRSFAVHWVSCLNGRSAVWVLMYDDRGFPIVRDEERHRPL